MEMCWYQQLPGDSMKLIVYTVPYSEPDFGEFSQDKFSATTNEAERGSFTVKNLQPGDSAVYLCAVSTLTVKHMAAKVHKNHRHMTQSGSLPNLIKRL